MLVESPMKRRYVICFTRSTSDGFFFTKSNFHSSSCSLRLHSPLTAQLVWICSSWCWDWFSQLSANVSGSPIPFYVVRNCGKSLTRHPIILTYKYRGERPLCRQWKENGKGLSGKPCLVTFKVLWSICCYVTGLFKVSTQQMRHALIFHWKDPCGTRHTMQPYSDIILLLALGYRAII